MPQRTPEPRAVRRLIESFPIPMAKLGAFHHYPPPEFADLVTEDPRQAPVPRALLGPGSLYVHVPFCLARCPFCPFLTFSGEPASELARYLTLLEREIALWASLAVDLRITALYFGGGTPGILSPAQFSRLYEGIALAFTLDDPEVTVEFNPAVVTRDKLRAYRDLGVTRASLGVQSFDAALLERIGRGYTAACVRQAAEALVETGFAETNLDLMVGLPGQSAEALSRDLDLAMTLAPPSITVYPTVYPPPQRMFFLSKGMPPPSRQETRALADLARLRLSDAGYHAPPPGGTHYLRTAINRYRENPLRGRPLLGLGIGAHSSTTAGWWRNLESVDGYRERLERDHLPVERVARVAKAHQPRKYVVESLKTGRLPGAGFRALFAADIAALLPEALEAALTLGLVERAGDDLLLTERGALHGEETRFLFADDALRAAIEARDFAPMPAWMMEEWAAMTPT